jgi:tetratricopeptide (TPR) repeat protein
MSSALFDAVFDAADANDWSLVVSLLTEQSQRPLDRDSDVGLGLVSRAVRSGRKALDALLSTGLFDPTIVFAVNFQLDAGTVASLIQAGARIDAQLVGIDSVFHTRMTRTPLSWQLVCNTTAGFECARVLLAAGANPAVALFTDVDPTMRFTRDSLLHYSLRRRDFRSAHLLLAAGAPWSSELVGFLPIENADLFDSLAGAALFPARAKKKAIDKAGLAVIRERIVDVCGALQDLELPVPLLIDIVLCDSACEPFAALLPYHILWDTVTTVRHRNRVPPKNAYKVRALAKWKHAVAWREAGDLVSAKLAFSDLLFLRRSLLGETHDFTCVALDALGGVLRDQGEWSGAQAAFSELADVWRQRDCDDLRWEANANRAEVLMLAGDLHAAESLLTEVLAHFAGREEFARLQAMLADVLRMLGRRDEAEQLVVNADERDAFPARSVLALIRRDQGRIDEARALFESIVATPPDEWWQVGHFRSRFELCVTLTMIPGERARVQKLLSELQTEQTQRLGASHYCCANVSKFETKTNNFQL